MIQYVVVRQGETGLTNTLTTFLGALTIHRGKFYFATRLARPEIFNSQQSADAAAQKAMSQFPGSNVVVQDVMMFQEKLPLLDKLLPEEGNLVGDKENGNLPEKTTAYNDEDWI
jgi:hypothetical protein